MSKKSYIIYIILLILVVFGIGIMVYARFRTPSFEAAEQSESTDAVSNPYCGFYHLYGYQLSEEGNTPAQKWVSSVLANDDNRIVLLQINLVNYKNKPISDSALSQLDSIITSLPQQTSRSFYASYTTGTEKHFKANRLPSSRFPATWMTLPLS